MKGCVFPNGTGDVYAIIAGRLLPVAFEAYKRKPMSRKLGFVGTAKAVVTDLDFYVPVVVLLAGIALLVALH